MALAWMLESCPAVITTKTTRNPRTRARASRFCNGPGDRLERTSPDSSGTFAAVFGIGAGSIIGRLANAVILRATTTRFADGRQKLRRVERLVEQAEAAAIGRRRSVHHVEVACDENDRKPRPRRMNRAQQLEAIH